jgi:hypothetical protein
MTKAANINRAFPALDFSISPLPNISATVNLRTATPATDFMQQHFKLLV